MAFSSGILRSEIKVFISLYIMKGYHFDANNNKWQMYLTIGQFQY